MTAARQYPPLKGYFHSWRECLLARCAKRLSDTPDCEGLQSENEILSFFKYVKGIGRTQEKNIDFCDYMETVSRYLFFSA